MQTQIVVILKKKKYNIKSANWNETNIDTNKNFQNKHYIDVYFFGRIFLLITCYYEKHVMNGKYTYNRAFRSFEWLWMSM